VQAFTLSYRVTILPVPIGRLLLQYAAIWWSASGLGESMVIDDVKQIIGSALQLGSRVEELDAAARLLGAIPELDSIAVVSVITALEEHFGIAVEDDDIDASTFETLGSLAAFVEQKLRRQVAAGE